MFVGVKTALDLAIQCGIGFSACDATHCKHLQYRSGQIHMVTTRDGNNKLLPLAWAICETESGDTHQWFADRCIEFGLAEYLDNDDSGVPTSARVPCP